MAARQDRAIAQLRKIVREVRQEDLKKSSCIGPLQAAPQALVQLGNCLKAASMSEPKAIKVENSRNGADGTIVQLPYEYLETNLEHCAHLGWEAFTTAEGSMRKLFYSSEDMLGADGTIAGIVRLLDDPETAKYHLRSHLDDVQDSASECKQEAGKIKDKFSYLVSFIAALHRAVTEKQNSTAEEKQKKEKEAADAARDEKIHESEQDRLEVLMSKQEDDVEEAKNARNSAQEAVDKAAKDDETQIMSIAEIGRLLDREEYTRAEESNGFFTEMRNYWFGKSDATRKREKESEKEWRDRRDKKMKELLEARRVEIDTVKKAAMEKLQQTRAIAQERQNELDGTQQRYQGMVHKHLSASKSRQTAHYQLQQLLAQKIDLSSVEKIIEESLKALKKVDGHIKLLYGFFKEIDGDISGLATSLTNQFLHRIEDSIRQSGNAAGAEIVENFQVAPNIKRSLIINTLKLQGRFSLAHDMAAVYVNISKQYILPGLDRLSDLTTGSAVAAQANYADFQKWEKDAVLGISDTIIRRRRENFLRMERYVMELAKEAKLIADVGDGRLPREAEVEEL